MTVLVGGVSQLYQGDLDLGRRAVERLSAEDLGPDVVIDDLHYGAVAVAQHLQDVTPDMLVLVGAEQRGRPPGTVERRRVDPPRLSAADTQRAVRDAVTGYVAIDLVVEVAAGLGALPRRTVAVEVEPATVEPSEELSGAAEAALTECLWLVRAEVRRAPLLALTDRLRELCDTGHLTPSPALDTIRALLDELSVLDAEGRWGATFSRRDEVRWRITTGQTSEDMTRLDWALWWGLIEEIDRLQAVEGVAALDP